MAQQSPAGDSLRLDGDFATLARSVDNGIIFKLLNDPQYGHGLLILMKTPTDQEAELLYHEIKSSEETEAVNLWIKDLLKTGNIDKDNGHDLEKEKSVIEKTEDSPVLIVKDPFDIPSAPQTPQAPQNSVDENVIEIEEEKANI